MFCDEDYSRLKKTKIVCTLGPSTDGEEIIENLILSGMNVARFNFSHGSHAEHKKRVDMVRRVSSKFEIPIALLLDTKGPELRIREFKDGRIELKKDDRFVFTTKDILGDQERVSVTYKNLPKDLAVGKILLVDDGKVEFQVTEIFEDEVLCVTLNDGVLTNKKSINIPDAVLSMPYISDCDREDILFGIENDFDFIAASFVRSASDLRALRNVLRENHGSSIQLIAKIESKEGVKNVDNIISLSDGVMIARGDMGVEIDFEELPRIQKMIIQKCCETGKKVITATQMLESMIVNPRPTRAETSDVANAVYDGTSAVMLSGETASGKYPVESVKTMSKIIKEAEADINYVKRFKEMELNIKPNVSYAISEATCSTAHNLDVRAIIAVTKSGRTARMISSFRPKPLIIATVMTEKVQRQLALSFGVYAIIVREQNNSEDLYDYVVCKALEYGCVKNGDLVVITGCSVVGVAGTTNTLKVRMVGRVLVTGASVNNLNVVGRAIVAKDEKSAMSMFSGEDILVLPRVSGDTEEFLSNFKAIVLEEEGVYSVAASLGMSGNVAVIHNAKDATDVIKTGDVITVDSCGGVVYGGPVGVSKEKEYF